jgi:rhodanese-related sulfurtransferase
MFKFLKSLIKSRSHTDYNLLIKSGAKIIDVRTASEFSSGHLKGSINIPLQEIGNHLSKFKKDDPIITCCRSGMRSASARKLLMENGFQSVHNGGSWNALGEIISKTNL